MSIKISEPQITSYSNYIKYSVEIHFRDHSEILWYQLTADRKEFISELSDAPLLALIIPAMALGEDIYVEGCVSDRLYYNLQNSYQQILQIIIPSLKRIRIYPSNINSQNERKLGKGVAAGFSAGIDSFCVLHDYYYSGVPLNLRLTHLLFNNVGSHGRGIKGRLLFRERYEKVKPVADLIGLPLIEVDTNMDDFYKDFTFQQTHTVRNASVALLLQNGIGRYFYASGLDYKNIGIFKAHDLAYSDLITLPLLSTDAIDITSVGSQYSRVEKTLKVATIKDSYTTLDICARGHKAGNCSTCWKCKRTLLTLEIAGLLTKYEHSFDIEAYLKVRDLYIAEVMTSKNPLLSEIAQFALENNFKTSKKSRIYKKIGVIYMLNKLIFLKRCAHTLKQNLKFRSRTQ